MKEGGGEGIYDFYLKKKKTKKRKKKTFSNKNHSSPTHWPPNCKGDEHQEDSRRGGVGRSGPVFEELLSMNFSEYFPMAVRAPHTPKIARAAVKETAIFIFSNHSLGISPEL